MTDTIKMVYTNYKGKTELRTVEPSRVWYGCTEWHPERQWLLQAWDVDKMAMRNFALTDCNFKHLFKGACYDT